jgi:peroxiredoxin
MRVFIAAMILLISITAMAGSEPSAGFRLTDIQGKQHRLKDYRGKWVLVNYWATWCPPCLEEVPDLVMLYDQHKAGNLMVIGVAMQYKTRKEVADFVDDMLMSYPIVLGDKSVTDQLGKDEILPTTFVFNPQGRLVDTKRGVITREYVETLLRKN